MLDKRFLTRLIMKFNKQLHSIAIASISMSLALGSCAAPVIAAQSGQATKVESTKTDKFSILIDEFVKESLALSPASASQAGYHKHKDKKSGETVELDAMLDDISRKALSNKRKFYSSYQKRFATEAPVESLSIQDQADWHLVNDQINLTLLDLENIQSHKYNPTTVVELIGSALFQPLYTNYAPPEVRMKHIVSRIKQVPRILKQAQLNLKKSSPVYTETALLENKGNIELIEKTIAKEVKAYPSLLEVFNQHSPKAISSLKSFSNWMKSTLKANDKDSWRLGKDLYDRKFKLVMQTNVSPNTLLAEAEKEMKAVRSEMMVIAVPMHMELFPDRKITGVRGKERENLIIGQVLESISSNHAKRGELIKTITKDLEEIKSFVRENKIVSLSKRDNLKVIPTPKFLRGIYSVAGFHSAPPLEPNSQAEYWVTPIEASMSDADAESKLKEYNNYTLKWLSIHEALPGHYIQFEHLNNIEPKNRRLLRSLYANGPYVEGWAEYIAQVMLNQGFMANSREFKLTMHKIRLRLLANTILDIKMHTMNMTDQEAMDLMTKDAFQTEAEAKGKLKRAKLSSAQLPTYYVGLKEWLAFRKRYQKLKGSKFDMLKFHDKVLDQGPLPVSYVEKILLPK